MMNLLNAHERAMLAAAQAGTLPHPMSRREADIRALQVLIGLGYLTPAQADQHGTAPGGLPYRDGDRINRERVREFQALPGADAFMIRREGNYLIVRERPAGAA